MLVYLDKITPRTRYIFRLLLKNMLGVELEFTTDIEKYKSHTEAKLNYSKQKPEDGVYIHAVSLLFETDIFEKEIYVNQFQGLPIFFSTSDNSALPFDVFAASFYLVSRYEEYLPFIPDQYGRFPASESLAFKNKFLQKPVVNNWVQLLKEKLLEAYPTLEIKQPKYKYISTIDVDNSFAYRGKGILRTLGGFAKDIWRLQFGNFLSRLQVLLHIKHDPFDTYSYQLSLQERFGYESLYFILFANFDTYDRNLPMHSNILKLSIKSLSDDAQVGIHPSYASNSSKKKLQSEIKGLEGAINKPITASRQHFLKITFPSTYRILMDMDIKDEYTMGYASNVGFRASICTPFPFYDLELEHETFLMIHPFALMDVSLMDYMKVGPSEAMEHITPLIEEVKKVRGQLITVWHNRTFSEKEPAWQGWNTVYEKMIAKATAQ